jgi:hypothetical protein
MHEEIPEKGLEMGGPDPKDEGNRWQVFLGKTHLHQEKAKSEKKRKFKISCPKKNKTKNQKWKGGGVWVGGS